MLRPRKRLTKREIKEDKFLEFVLRASVFVRKHRTHLIGGVLAIVLAVVGTNLALKGRETKQLEAAELLADARMAGTGGQVDEAIRLGEQIIRDFGSTRSAQEALVLLGNAYFDMERYDQAMELFQRYLKESNQEEEILRYAAWSGLAACLEEQGRYGEAGEQYRQYGDENRGSPYAAWMLLDAARCFKLSGEKGKAEAVLERILVAYPDSEVAFKARRARMML